MHFADRLIEAIQKKGSCICVGLDPQLPRVPAFLVKQALDEHGQTLTAAAHAIFEFNKGIIDAVKDLVPIVKLQIAFYEEYGFQGIWAFEETARYAKEQGLLVIADGKRNDIGSTAEAYARTFLGKTDLFGVKTSVMDLDALTINAYLGYDGVKPFLDVCREEEKGIFVLVRTSNPSSGDLQDRVTVDEQMPIASLMAHFVESWGSQDIGDSGYSYVGAVVGATFPQQAVELRRIMPNTIFLVPGYGAQGATAEDVKPCFNEDGLGAIINSSREIIFAYEKSGATKSGEDYAEAARDKVIFMREDLTQLF